MIIFFNYFIPLTKDSDIEAAKKVALMLEEEAGKSAKAKVKWAIDGDENSKLFHAVIKLRERKNAVRGIQTSVGWEEDPLKVKDHFFNFFKNKFDSCLEGGPVLGVSNFKKISAEEAIELERPFEEGEIWAAIKDCGSYKSPGPDGFTFGFLKKFWDLIKSDLMKATTWFWEKEELGSGCNSAFLPLIPKVVSPIHLGDFRPISLIGVFYKILAKLLAERIKKVIGKLISNPQSAFIKGRSILDGILIANEVVDYVRKKKRKSFIFKVDFEKAYDSVEWSFLLDCLRKMGFGEKWVNWIEACLKSSTLSVLVNGSPTKEFPMKRGLRQGDPLAPFLFLIVAECLNILMRNAGEKGLIEGIQIGREGCSISHLQYADDVIMFGSWSVANFKNVLKVLECFYKLSGLKINVAKSKLFGVGVPEELVTRWARSAGCGFGKLPFLYLGLSVGASMKRLDHWKPVMDKIKKRLDTWKSRFVSSGGRLTLVKSVLGSLPLYYFSLFRAPRGVLNECTIWSTIIRSGSVLDSKGINFSKAFVKNVGNGRDTSFWKERWFGQESLQETFPRLYRLEKEEDAKVSDRRPRGRELGKLEDFLARSQHVKLSENKTDKMEWTLDTSKEYSAKKMRVILENQEAVSALPTVWSKLVPKKVCTFIWRARLDRLPCRVNLDKRGLELDSLLCPRCGEVVETSEHALLGCSEVADLWNRIGNWWDKPTGGCNTIVDFVQSSSSNVKCEDRDAIWSAIKWCDQFYRGIRVTAHNLPVRCSSENLVFKKENKSIAETFFEWQRKAFEWVIWRSKGSQADWMAWLSARIAPRNRLQQGAVLVIIFGRMDSYWSNRRSLRLRIKGGRCGKIPLFQAGSYLSRKPFAVFWFGLVLSFGSFCPWFHQGLCLFSSLLYCGFDVVLWVEPKVIINQGSHHLPRGTPETAAGDSREEHQKEDNTGQGDSSKILGSTTHFSCPILNSTNYTTWAIRMQVILEANGLWDMIEPQPTTQADAKKDKTAIAYLYQALPEEQLLLISKYKTAKAVWDALNKTRGCRLCPTSKTTNTQDGI
ncbi:hypothetical protein OSB04_012609 [Centaurea solstitialis]|uniref:Reverse transcriptase domain-containing protein n=1 Tax=Centaurea solstitialis TaxID=347529 RepID=A0AA38TNE5_9ASTR|nr:hypothetical protein OSB04_012609 [Centaurea solstitialis]